MTHKLKFDPKSATFGTLTKNDRKFENGPKMTKKKLKFDLQWPKNLNVTLNDQTFAN